MSVHITADEMIPTVLRAHPECREVLDRHGLQGCGGPLGPHESIRFFAEAHGASLRNLMDELNAAVALPKTAVVCPAPPGSPFPLSAKGGAADTIYRPFFLGAVVVMLTAGCVWGAANLYRIGSRGDFFAVPLNWTLAHAHAQILGWVGLFVMGFAYQAFPRFRGARLKAPGLAYLSLGLMLAGIVASAVGQTYSHARGMLALGIAGGALEVVAVTAFLALIFRTMHGGDRSTRETMVGAPFIMAALAAFWLQTALGPVLFHAVATAPDEFTLVPLLAGWMTAMRELQVFGFITMMIFGVSLRLLPAIFGLNPQAATEAERAAQTASSRRDARIILGVFALSIIADVAGWIGLFVYQLPGLLLLLRVSFIGLLVSAILVVSALGIFGPARKPDRSLKFVRAAYVWLLVGLVMLNMMFPYSMFRGQAFSHAYLGAVRHALTVGFITLMIVGVSSRVVPMLRGIDPRTLNGLWLPFVLINAGNVLRVGTQIATDFTHSAYAIMGLSGFIEVVGLVIWAVELVAIMWRSPRLAEPLAPPSELPSMATRG